MDERDPKDERLASLMRAVRAEIDPALWTRVRARLEADEDRRGVIGWLMRPAALAASVAALALASVLSVALVRDAELSARYAGADGLTEALVGAQSPLDDLSIPVEADDDSPADSGATS